MCRLSARHCRLEASGSLSPDDEIGLEESYLVTMRLCLGFRRVRNKGLGHRAVERGSLVVLAPAEGDIHHVLR